MLYSHTVTTTLDDTEATEAVETCVMSADEAQELAKDLIAEGHAAVVNDRLAALADRFPPGATVVHVPTGRRAVVTSDRVACCPVAIGACTDPTARTSVAIDFDGTEMIYVSGEVNRWYLAKAFTLLSAE